MNTQELVLSQLRWLGDEPDVGLTWGSRRDGVDFVNFICTHTHTEATDTIVEIGPGYGRITKALIRQHVPFGRYVGLELSPARVKKLSRVFSVDRRCEFKQADILSLGELDIGDVALTFGAAVFEHLYPDFGKAIQAIWQFTKPGGILVFDVIRHDDAMLSTYSEFCTGNTTYFRIYSLTEVVQLLSDNGFILRAVAPQSLGIGMHGDVSMEIKRATIACQKV